MEFFAALCSTILFYRLEFKAKFFWPFCFIGCEAFYGQAKRTEELQRTGQNRLDSVLVVLTKLRFELQRTSQNWPDSVLVVLTKLRFELQRPRKLA
jgi:hypothetical protein